MVICTGEICRDGFRMYFTTISFRRKFENWNSNIATVTHKISATRWQVSLQNIAILLTKRIAVDPANHESLLKRRRLRTVSSSKYHPLPGLVSDSRSVR